MTKGRLEAFSDGVIDARVLSANLHLLFWLSLFPFGTAWVGQSDFAPMPVAAYG